MKVPTIPADEEQRLSALHGLDILDTPAEERFERITKLACRTLGVPIAALSLIDRDRQWFKSIQGLNASQTSRDISFCGHAINGEDNFIVGDARQDPRFFDNPLVAGDPNIAFYAGCPVHSPDGSKVGTLCVIDSKPRSMQADDQQLLRDLAALVESELQISALNQTQRDLITELDGARRQALIDPLTQLWNRDGIFNIFERELERARRNDLHDAIIMADLDHFKAINDTYGHPSGDAVLREASRRMLSAVRPYDSVGRYGGEEFMVVVVEGKPNDAEVVAERIRTRIAESPVRLPDGEEVGITVSLGVTPVPSGREIETLTVVNAADGALYQAKHAGRNRIVTATL